ncbi:hypothetical protein ACFE04_031271 [Oxalis oulophora]
MGESSSTAIGSSNIGFQLLKKHGWKEGSGLGISEQGRLEPVEAFANNNKRGLGSEKLKKVNQKTKLALTSKQKNDKEKSSLKKSKPLSKKMRKMQELEKRQEEKEFERAFMREFWPENY